MRERELVLFLRRLALVTEHRHIKSCLATKWLNTHENVSKCVRLVIIHVNPCRLFDK